MPWDNNRFHQDWVHLGKVANATFVNPRNQHKWVFQDLDMQNYSPWCTTWCSAIIWDLEHAHKGWEQNKKVDNVKLFKFDSGQRGFWGTLIKISFSPTCAIWSRYIIIPLEHVHQVWEHLDMFGNVKLLKLQNGQKWFWGDFMGLYYSPWHDTCQDHQTCHMWHARIFLEFLENISFVNISKAWNIQKGFLRDLTNILNMTMCWNSYIWTIYVHWVSLGFSQIFLKH